MVVAHIIARAAPDWWRFWGGSLVREPDITLLELHGLILRSRSFLLIRRSPCKCLAIFKQGAAASAADALIICMPIREFVLHLDLDVIRREFPPSCCRERRLKL